MISLEKSMILAPLQKLPKNMEDLGKLIVAKGFKKLSKVQKIAISGHTEFKTLKSQANKFRFDKLILWFWADHHQNWDLLDQFEATEEDDLNVKMTTAARPTFDTARGGTGARERDLSAMSKQYSSRDL